MRKGARGMTGETLSAVEPGEVVEPGEGEDVMADRPEDSDCWDKPTISTPDDSHLHTPNAPHCTRVSMRTEDEIRHESETDKAEG